MEKNENIEQENIEEIIESAQDEIVEEENVDTLNKPEDELEDLKSQLIRLQADFANFRKRSEKERTEFVSFGVRRLAMSILPVIDNFERALANDCKKDAFYEGVQMIYNQLVESLKESGIFEMEAVGAVFDPNFHNAVMMVDSDIAESGQVVEVLQKGYMYNDQVIRPAMVKVAN